MVAKSTGIDVEQNYVTITLCIKCILIFNCRVLMIDCVGSVNYFCGLVGLDFKILRWVEFQKSTHVQLCVKRHLKLFFFFFFRVWRLPSPRYFRCILSRDAMLARYLLPSCVRPSVCPFVTSRYCIETSWQIELVVWHESFLWPVLHYVITKFGYFQK